MIPIKKSLGLIGPALGGACGIAGMVAAADVAHLPLALAPFTTSIVLVMAAPDSRFARARNVIGGHVVCALAGLLVLATLGNSPWFAALAVGLAIAAMQVSDTMHPPAGINALLMVTAHPSWTFVLMPVASGAIVLVLFAALWRRGLAALEARATGGGRP
jgi:CBS-domain-containing membrane protein